LYIFIPVDVTKSSQKKVANNILNIKSQRGTVIFYCFFITGYFKEIDNKLKREGVKLLGDCFSLVTIKK
jgi:hypothetical protein